MAPGSTARRPIRPFRTPARSTSTEPERRARRSVRPLVFAPVLAVLVLVRHDEVVRDLARLLRLDDALEHELALGLGRLDLDVGDVGREHEQLADELLRARQLDDAGVLVLGD